MTVRPVVLYVHSSADLYGSDRSLLALTAGVSGRYEPVVVVPCEGPLVEELRERGVRVETIPLAVLRRGESMSGMARRWRRAMPLMRRLVADVGPAIVHSNTLAVTEGACAARLAGVPHVYHVREMILSPAAFRRATGLVATLTSQHVIANSSATGSWFVGRNPVLRRRLSVVWNGRSYASGEPPEPREARDDASVVFALIARLNTWKGQDLTLRALGVMPPETRARVRVIFAGDAFPGKEHIAKDLELLAARLGVADRVEFVGYIDSADVLRRSDVVLVPSLTPEPFGNVLLEAMEVGLPIIATAQGGPLDVVIDDVTGLLVAPRPDALAGAMRRLADDPELRARLGANGWRRARSTFTLERTLDGVLSVYDDLLSPYRRRVA
jgi:glycosyltransferase involved in cell wall biosynthesis